MRSEAALPPEVRAALLGRQGRAATTRNWAAVLKIGVLLREGETARR